MTILDRAAGALRPPRADVRPATPTAAVLAAVQAAGGSLLVVLAPAVVGWLATPERTTWTGVLRVGALLWLLGQHVPVTVTGGELSFAPLGLLAVCCASLVTAGRRMSRVLDPLADRIESGASRATPSLPGVAASAMFVAAYAALAGLVAALAGTGPARPDPLAAMLIAAVLAAVFGLVGELAYVAGGVRRVPGVVAARLPGVVRGAVRPAVAALAVQVGAGAVLLAAALALQRDYVMGLHHELAPGAAGGAVLTLAQVAVLPNLVVWAAALLAGPGFVVGAGTSVTPAAIALGALPAVPVLGALPAPGLLPGVALLLLAVPFVAGGVAGLLVVRHRGPESRRWAAALDTVVVGLVAGLGFAALTWASGGGIGPGRLAEAGPSPLAAGAAFAAEVAVGALVAVGARAALPGQPGVWSLPGLSRIAGPRRTGRSG
jgi:hypothetical protein